jgi:hypothetical protein
MVDKRPDDPALLEPSELPVLLEWYASYCFSLAEKCEQRRAARLLRLLSVDLVASADRRRREFRSQSVPS